MTSNTPSTSELIRIVGEERSQHSVDEVAAAERMLGQRATQEREKTASTIPRNGRIVAAIGLVIGLWPVALIPVVLCLYLDLYDVLYDTDELPAWEIAFLAAAAVVGLLQAVCGFVLLAGGLKFCHRSDWGRRAILAVLWIGIGYCFCFGVVWEIIGAIEQPWSATTIPMLILGPLVTAFWIFLLWLPKRYFSSPTVVSLCREESTKPEDVQ